MTIVIHGLIIGILATILIDVWALILKYVFKLPTTNWAMVGRWVRHLHHGQFVHNSISDAVPIAGEGILGWVTHYLIGVLYAVGYFWFVNDVLNHFPNLISAVTFSMVLLVAPWFILQPGLGVGILARRAPNPWLLRGISISVHLVFGIGLYIGWVLVG